MNYRILHIIILVSVFTSCTNERNEVTVESSTDGLELVNGVLEFNKIPFSGRLINSFSKDKLKSEIFYTEGEKHGSEKFWFESGVLAQERFYINGFKSGMHRAWWSSNQPKFVYHFNNRGAFDGEVKEWYKTGQLYMSFNYKNGKEKGSQRLWKVDGTIKANYEVIHGDRFGLIGLKKCSNVSTPKNQ